MLHQRQWRNTIHNTSTESCAIQIAPWSPPLPQPLFFLFLSIIYLSIHYTPSIYFRQRCSNLNGTGQNRNEAKLANKALFSCVVVVCRMLLLVPPLKAAPRWFRFFLCRYLCFASSSLLLKSMPLSQILVFMPCCMDASPAAVTSSFNTQPQATPKPSNQPNHLPLT